MAELKAHAGLAALVGARIYGGVAPQGAALPYVTHQQVSSVYPAAMHSDTGLAGPIIMLKAWGSTYDEAKNVRDQIKACLKRKRGTMGSGSNTVSGVASFLETDFHDYEPDTKRHCWVLDFRIWHEE